MKRMKCILLAFAIFLSGCSAMGERVKEPVTFYYVCEDYQKDMEHVIASEVREASGHKEDLSYLLALYSMGPSTEDLKLLLPRNTKITLAEHTEEALTLNLSEGVLSMTDADFTLASACIAMTCMELAGTEKVVFLCGDRNITIQKNNLLLYMNQKTVQEETK